MVDIKYLFKFFLGVVLAFIGMIFIATPIIPFVFLIIFGSFLDSVLQIIFGIIIVIIGFWIANWS